MGVSLYLIAGRTGQPVLDLQDDAIDHVNDEACEQHPLKQLDQGVAGHEMSGSVEEFASIIDQ